MKKITPRDYQARVHDATLHYLWNTPKARGLALEPTGVGKSVQIAMLVDAVANLMPGARILMLTHSKELVEQNYEKLVNMTNHHVGLWSSGLGKADYHAPIVYAGIQTAANNPEMLGRRDLIIVDEAHRVSPDDQTEYQKVARYLEGMNPNASWIGYTATDYRLGQGLLTNDWFDKRRGEDVPSFWKEVIVDLTTTEEFNWFISQGYLKRLVPRPTNAEIDVSGLRKRSGEYVTSDVEKLTNTEAKIREICDEVCEMGFDRRSWMVFAAGNANSELVCAELNRRGVSCVSITDKTPKKEREQAIADFKAYKIRCIVNNNILTTGFDHPGVDLIAVVRVTTSTQLWCLSDDTEVLTDDGWMTRDQIKSGMFGLRCASVDASTLEFKYAPILGYIERPLHPEETMISIDLPRANFNVSNKHRMLVTKIAGRKKERTAPYFCAAEEMIDQSRIDIPVSAVNNGPRTTGLSDDALRFIGLYLSDGTIDRSNNRLEIRQSDRYPHVQAEIERLIDVLGLKASIRHRTAEEVNRLSNFSTVYGNKVYRVSYGSTTLAGWQRFEDFVDKRISGRLFNCNREELTALLYGLNLGDGMKHVPKDWTRRTMDIAVGTDKVIADRLQIMCIKNGYSCSVSHNGNGCYIIRIQDIRWKSICKGYGEDSRNTIQADATYSGNVWCIENENGTLITRRKGKVTVMGNCQMLGRGTRPVFVEGFDLSTQEGRLQSIAASGVHNCLVLDFAGNSKRLGAINAPVKPKAKGEGGGGDMPVKICGSCGSYNATIVRYCEYCGHEFPVTDKLDKTASTRDLIVEKEHVPDKRILHVTSIQFAEITRGYAGNASGSRIKATYKCGKHGSYHEMLSFSGEKSSKRIKEWWTAFGDGDRLPASNNEFIKYYTVRVKTPKVIEVYMNNPKKHVPEIIYYGFEDASHFASQLNDADNGQVA